MKPLVCDLCGGSLSISDNGESAVCDFCGIKYQKEYLTQKIQEIRGTVEITKGDSEKERLLENGETYIQLGEYSKAKRAFIEVTEQFPNDYRGWWGLYKIPFLAFLKRNLTESLNREIKFEEIKIFENAFNLCGDSQIYLPIFIEFMNLHTEKIILTDDIFGSAFAETTEYFNIGLATKERIQTNLSKETFWIIEDGKYVFEKLRDDRLKILSEHIETLYLNKILDGELFPYIGWGRHIFNLMKEIETSTELFLGNELSVLRKLLYLNTYRYEKNHSMPSININEMESIKFTRII